MDWQSAQNLLSSSSSRLARTAWYRSTSFTDLPVMARVPAGAEGDAPSPPQKPLPQSGGEDSRSPAQGHLLSGGNPSPRARPSAPSLVSRARPPLCSPSVRRPLAGSGKGPSPEEPAGLETLSSGKRGAQRRHPRPPPACLRPAPRFPWQLPPARPPPRPPTSGSSSSPPPPCPARACAPPLPRRTGLFPRLRLSGTNPGRSEGRCLRWAEGGVGTPPACPWKRMNGA